MPTPTVTALPTRTTEPNPTLAPPTATPMPETPQWDYVALGDQIVMVYGDYSYAPHYAAFIEADLGVKVTLHLVGNPHLTT